MTRFTYTIDSVSGVCIKDNQSGVEIYLQTDCDANSFLEEVENASEKSQQDIMSEYFTG
jgi:hypothetical protein